MKCSIINCDKKSVSRGWCKMHYTRWERHGDPNFTVIMPKGMMQGLECLVADCHAPMKYKGFCKKHYKRLWRHGNPEKTLIDVDNLPEGCKAPGCIKSVRYPSTGLCHVHHIRVTRFGRFHSIRGNNGEGSRNSDGYKVFRIAGKFFYEHVMIAERALGKKLPRGAIVHHFDENKTNNSSSNLIICPSQAYHLLLHRRANELKFFGECRSI